MPNKNHLHVVLIRSSLYDDDGYVIQYTRGVLPSNTLAVINGLTHAVDTRSWGEAVTITTELLDEIVDPIDANRLARRAAERGGKTIFCLCGVQSNQFPRASDIAMALRQHDLTVLIGGFHVSGIRSVFGRLTEEITRLMDAGVTVVTGEIENTWDKLLQAAWLGKLEREYDFLGEKPALKACPTPFVPATYLNKFSVRGFSTMDCGRGCPFRCSFCSIINVHGNEMRNRDTAEIRRQVITNYRDHDVRFYFFTDDNFSRNRRWPEIFNMLADLRAGGFDITFMMQVDLQSYKIPGFLEASVRAGCTQVFLGMESLNPKNLIQVGKSQNKVSEYRDMVAAWRERGVMTHTAYIIGFDHDDPQSIAENMQTLAFDVAVDLASFFILTPIPGSMDHKAKVVANAKMNPDLNFYDTFHSVTDHPLMTGETIVSTYWQIWDFFYSRKRMEFILRQLKGQALSNMLGSYLWYKYAVKVARIHPMVTGFHRRKFRLSRRPGFEVEGRMRFLWRRTVDITREITTTLSILAEFAYYYVKYLPAMRRKAAHGESRFGRVTQVSAGET